MKVFQLNTYCGIKSTGRIALTLAQYIDKAGGQCLIGYGVPELSEASEPYACAIGNRFSRKLHAAFRKLFDAEGYGSFFSTIALLRKMNDFQPDIIHLHNIHGCYVNLSLLFHYIRRHNIPVVWTLHDCWPFTGHCAYFDVIGCDKWRTGCSDCPQLRSYPTCIGADGSNRNYRHKKKWFQMPQRICFAAPCSWMKERLEESFLKEYNACVIYNGIDEKIFQPTSSTLRERYHIKDKKLVLGVASEWDERKGLRYLLEAAKILGEDYYFVVIGKIYEPVTPLSNNITFISSTNDALQLSAWYSTADCLANPTLEDNMPTVNLEALSCGTPVVAFDTGGCDEAIGNCGCVVPKGNLDAFCSEIGRYSIQKHTLFDSCIERAKAYRMDCMGKSYLQLYEELLK